jgi:hypothetical protein
MYLIISSASFRLVSRIPVTGPVFRWKWATDSGDEWATPER